MFTITQTIGVHSSDPCVGIQNMMVRLIIYKYIIIIIIIIIV